MVVATSFETNWCDMGNGGGGFVHSCTKMLAEQHCSGLRVLQYLCNIRSLISPHHLMYRQHWPYQGTVRHGLKVFLVFSI